MLAFTTYLCITLTVFYPKKEARWISADPNLSLIRGSVDPAIRLDGSGNIGFLLAILTKQRYRILDP